MKVKNVLYLQGKYDTYKGSTRTVNMITDLASEPWEI